MEDVEVHKVVEGSTTSTAWFVEIVSIAELLEVVDVLVIVEVVAVDRFVDIDDVIKDLSDFLSSKFFFLNFHFF